MSFPAVTSDYCRWDYLREDQLPTGADPEKLVCCYRLDGKTDGKTDRSGNGHDLTVSGAGGLDYYSAAPSLGVNSAEFRTNTWWMGPTGLSPQTLGEFTVEAIFTPTLWTTDEDYIFQVGGVAGDVSPDDNITVSMRVDNGAAGGRMMSLIEYNAAMDNEVISFDFVAGYHQMIYAALTRAADGKTYRLYLNGIFCQEKVATNAPYNGAGSEVRVRVGGLASGDDYYGYISSLRYTKECYTDAQILESYLACRIEGCGMFDAEPTSVTPRVAWSGGEEISLGGTFHSGSVYEAYLGKSGDDTDEPCYGGLAGHAYEAYSDGTSLAFISPRLTLADLGECTLTVYRDGEAAFQVSLDVIEESFTDELFKLRTRWPDQYDVGARSILLEEDQ